MPTYSEAVELFERRRRAWLDSDVDAYLALWAPDMTFQSPVHAEPLAGRAEFAKLIRMSGELSRPLTFEIVHIAVRDSLVLAEWNIAVEWRADGRRSAWRGMGVCEIRDGLICWWREYWNPADLTPEDAPTR